MSAAVALHRATGAQAYGTTHRHNESLQSAWDASQKRLMDAQRKAIDKLAELMDDDDTATALKATAALVRITIPRPTGSTNPLGVEPGTEWWRRSLMAP